MLQGRGPLDLLSEDLQIFLGSAPIGEMYSWGNGANYQLGSGAVGLQETPVRLDSLHGISLKAVAAAKFHSAAISQEGQLFTWGFGRGGRLGEAGVCFPENFDNLSCLVTIHPARMRMSIICRTDYCEEPKI